MKFRCMDGGFVELATDALSRLRSSLAGSLVCEGDAEYENTRAIWNAMIERKPRAFVVCAAAEDAKAAVDFAREHRVMTSIRGAGHNIAGNSLCEGGLVIDLSQMKSVRVDASAKRAFAQGGVTLGDLDAATAKHGLATPTGINSTTGIAGLTLGGGFGWLSRKYGVTCDNLVGAQVVTAAGEMLRVDAKQNADLFWALRGGSGNFGVVTEFEYQLHAVGPELFSGLVVYPAEEAKQVLTKFRDWAATLPDEATVWSVLRQAPPLPFLPEEVHGKDVVVFAMCYSGDPAKGEEILAPVRSFGTPYGEHLGVMPFAAWQQAFDPLLTPGARNYWKSHNFVELPDDLLDCVVEYAGKLPSPQCEIFIAQLGGQINRVPVDSTAYPHRDANFTMNVHGRWDAAAGDAAGIGWAREFFEAAAPFATGGVYVNFMTEDEAERSDAAYGSNYERLTAIKHKYDPDNLFRTNQNIAP